MASKSHITGMRGVYLVAAELSKRGFIVSPTSRSAVGADLLITDQKCKRAYSVQVKTNVRTHSFWLIGKKARDAVSDSHIYVSVNIRKSKKRGEWLEFYIVPSRRLVRIASHDGRWPHIRRDKIENFMNDWSAFGEPD